MKKINVLFVIVKMKMGGSEHLVWDLVRCLDRNLFSPHIAWLFEKDVLPEFAGLNVPLFYTPKNRRFDFSTMRHIGRIIRNHRIDVVNAHHFISLIYSLYGAKLANRAGLVYTEHSLWEIESISPRWRFMGKKLVPLADASVGISDKVTGGLERVFGLDDARTRTIANGVDCQMLHPADDRHRSREKFGLQPDEVVIGVVANLKNNKNHLFLLRAFTRLVHDGQPIKLLVIGQGFDGDPESSEEKIHSFIRQERIEKSVLLLGSRSDVPDLLRLMDIFCLTSYQEGLPISLIEAMATGLPVIGTKVAGIRDVIEEGTNGFLVEPDDVESLYTRLHKLIEDPAMRLRFGEMSRSFAKNSYSLADCVKSYQRLFAHCFKE